MGCSRRGFAGLWLAAFLGAAAGGCASRAVGPGGPEPAADEPACALLAGPGEAIAMVALGEPVDPANAPRPSNPSERLLFRQIYETLVRVDCEGRVSPGLAASWRLDAGTGAWIVTLRDGARFSDGTLLTPAEVVAAWSGDRTGDGLRPEVARTVRTVAPVDDRTLAITLQDAAQSEAPVALADAGLAVVRRTPASRWPLGTRAAVTTSAPAAGTGGRMTATLTWLPAEGLLDGVDGAAGPIRFLVDPGRDPRDHLDEGVDLLVTSDPAALDYAATLPQFQALPLAWHRVHVFIAPRREAPAPRLSEAARQALAADAVRSAARGAAGPFWWDTLARCDIAPPQPAGEAPLADARIVYEQGDEASRDLAERIVGLGGGADAAAILEALSGSRRVRYQRAAGLTGADLAPALARGAGAGYVIAIDRAPADPCPAWRALAARAPWIEPGAIVPLVDTRLAAVVRRQRSGLTSEWDGGLLIARPAGGEH